MKNIHIVFSILITILSACSKEDTPILSNGTGELKLQALSADMETEIPIIYTKSREFDMDPNSFYILISDDKGNKYKDFPSYAEMIAAGVPLILPIGSYSIKASSFNPTNPVSETPYFEDVQNFNIEEKTVTNVSLTCTFESLGVELKISDRLAEMIQKEPENYTYSVIVSNDVASWTFDKEKINPVYFLNTCKELSVRVNVKLNGTIYPERIYRFTNDGAEPQLGEYYIITLDAGKENLKMESRKVAKTEVTQ